MIHLIKPYSMGGLRVSSGGFSRLDCQSQQFHSQRARVFYRRRINMNRMSESALGHTSHVSGGSGKKLA
jgi:hypothetical protein